MVYGFPFISVGDRLSVLTPQHVSYNIDSAGNFTLRPGSNLDADWGQTATPKHTEPLLCPCSIVKIHPILPGRFESPLLPNRHRVAARQTRGAVLRLSRSRACPQLESSGAVISSLHRGSADLELTDAALWPARRPMGAYPRPAAWAGGSCGSDRGGQPAVRRGGAVSLSHRYPVARPAGALRRLEQPESALQPIGQIWCLGEGLPASFR